MYPVLGVLALVVLVAGVYLYRHQSRLNDLEQKVGGFVKSVADRVSKS